MASNFDVILNVLGLDKVGAGSRQAAAELKKMETGVDAVERKFTGFSGALGNFDKGVKNVGTSANQAGPPLQNIATHVGKLDTTMGTTTQKTTGLGTGFKQLGSSTMASVGAFSAMTGSAISLWQAYDGLGDAQLNVDKAQNALQTSTLKLEALEIRRAKLIEDGKQGTAEFALVEDKLALAHDKVAAATGTLQNAQEDLATTQANYVREIIPMLVTTGGSALTMFSTMKDNLGGLKTAFSNMIPAVKSLGSTLSLISLTNPFFIAITVGAGLVLALSTNLFGFRDAVMGVGKAIGDAIPFLKPFLQAIGDFGAWIGSLFGGGAQEAQAFEADFTGSMEGSGEAVEAFKLSAVKSVDDLSKYLEGLVIEAEKAKKNLAAALNPDTAMAEAATGRVSKLSYSQLDKGGVNKAAFGEATAAHYRGLIVGIEGVVSANGKLIVSEEELRGKLAANGLVGQQLDTVYQALDGVITTVANKSQLDAVAKSNAAASTEKLSNTTGKLNETQKATLDTGTKLIDADLRRKQAQGVLQLAYDQLVATEQKANAEHGLMTATLLLQADAYGITDKAIRQNFDALSMAVLLKQEEEAQNAKNIQSAERLIQTYGIERSELIQNGKVNEDALKTWTAVTEGRDEYRKKTDEARLADIKFLESVGVNTDGIRNNAAELSRLVTVYTEYQAQMDAAAKVTDEFVKQVTENGDATQLAVSKLDEFAQMMGFTIPEAYRGSIENMKLYVQTVIDLNSAHETAEAAMLKWQTALQVSNKVAAVTYLQNIELAESLGLLEEGMQPSIKALDDMVKAQDDWVKKSEDAIKRWGDAWLKGIDENKSELQKGVDNYNKIAEELFGEGKIKGLSIDQKDIDKFEDDINDMTEKAVVYLRTDSTDFGKDFEKDKNNLIGKMQDIQNEAGLAAGDIGDKFGKLWTVINNPNLDDRAIANAIALMGPAALDEAKNVVIPAFGAMSEAAQQEMAKIPTIISDTFKNNSVENDVNGFKNNMLLQLQGLSEEGQQKMAPLIEFLKQPIPEGTGINQYVGEVISWFETLSGQEIPQDIKDFIANTLGGSATGIKDTATGLAGVDTNLKAIAGTDLNPINTGIGTLASNTTAVGTAAAAAKIQVEALATAQAGVAANANVSVAIPTTNPTPGGGGGTAQPEPAAAANAPDTRGVDAALAKLQQYAAALALLGPATGVAVAAANAEFGKLNPLSPAFTAGMTTLATSFLLLGPAAKVGTDAAQVAFNSLNPNSPTFSANMQIIAAAFQLLGPAAKVGVDAANVEFNFLNPNSPAFGANMTMVAIAFGLLGPAAKVAVDAANVELGLLGSTMSATVLPYFSEMISAIVEGPYADLQNATAVTAEGVVNIVAEVIPGIVPPFTEAVNTIVSGPLQKIQTESGTAFSAVANMAESEFPKIATAMQGATNDAIQSLGELQNAAAAVFNSVRTDADAATLSVASLVNTINMLEDKTITITTVYETVGTPVGAAGGFGPSVVDHPTLLMVGEAGPEYVHVTPLRQGSHANMTPKERLNAYADPGRTRIAPTLMAQGTTGTIDDAPFGMAAFGYRNNFSNGQGGTLPLTNDSQGKFDVRLLWLGAGNNIIGSALPVEIVGSRIPLGGGGGGSSGGGGNLGGGSGSSSGSGTSTNTQTRTNTGNNINFDSDTNTSSNTFPGGSSGGASTSPSGSGGSGIGVSPGAGISTPRASTDNKVHITEDDEGVSIAEWNSLPDARKRLLVRRHGGIYSVPPGSYVNEDLSISSSGSGSVGGGGGTSTSPGGSGGSVPPGQGTSTSVDQVGEGSKLGSGQGEYYKGPTGYWLPTYVKTSGKSDKWKNQNMDPATWHSTQMTSRGYEGLWKVCDDNDKIIAAEFKSQAEADEFIAEHVAAVNYPGGVAPGVDTGGGGAQQGGVTPNDMGGTGNTGGVTGPGTGGTDFVPAGNTGGGGGGTSTSPGGGGGGHVRIPPNQTDSRFDRTPSGGTASTVGNGGWSPKSGYIKPGGWGANSWYEDWFTVRMRDNNALFKITDGRGVNVATDFISQDDADQFSNYYILNNNHRPPGTRQSSGTHNQTERLPPGFPNKKASELGSGGGGGTTPPIDTGGTDSNGSPGSVGSDGGNVNTGGGSANGSPGAGGGTSTSPGTGTSTSPGGGVGTVQPGGQQQFNYQNNDKFYRYKNGQVETNMTEQEILAAEQMLGFRFPGRGPGAGGGGGTVPNPNAGPVSGGAVGGNVGNGGPFWGEPTSAIPHTTRGLNGTTPLPNIPGTGAGGPIGGGGGGNNVSGQFIDAWGVHQGNQHVGFNGQVIQGNQVIGGSTVVQGGGTSTAPGGSTGGGGGTSTAPGGTTMSGNGNQVSVQTGNGKYYQSQNGVVNTNMSASEIAALNAQFPWLHLNPGGAVGGGGTVTPGPRPPNIPLIEPGHMAWRSGWDPMNGITEFDSAKGPIDNAPFGMNGAAALRPNTPWSPGRIDIGDLIGRLLDMIGGMFGNIFGGIGGMMDNIFGGQRGNNSININNTLDGEALARNTVRRINGRLTLFNS